MCRITYSSLLGHTGTGQLLTLSRFTAPQRRAHRPGRQGCRVERPIGRRLRRGSRSTAVTRGHDGPYRRVRAAEQAAPVVVATDAAAPAPAVRCPSVQDPVFRGGVRADTASPLVREDAWLREVRSVTAGRGSRLPEGRDRAPEKLGAPAPGDGPQRGQSQSHHSSTPSPVRALAMTVRALGFTAARFARNLGTSTSRWGRRSTLFTTTRSRRMSRDSWNFGDGPVVDQATA